MPSTHATGSSSSSRRAPWSCPSCSAEIGRFARSRGSTSACSATSPGCSLFCWPSSWCPRCGGGGSTAGGLGVWGFRWYPPPSWRNLAGVFAWFGWTALRGRPRRFAFGALVQGFAVLAGLHLLNPDAFIVRTNLSRPPSHRPFDAAYAASLSADAVHDLLAAFPQLDEREKCLAAARLLRRWTRDDDWRTWNLSRVRARRSVREQEATLRALPCKEYGS